MKLKSFVLGAGLAAVGFIGAVAFAEIPYCNGDHKGQKKDDPKYCRGNDYVFSGSKSCKCPHPNVQAEKTRKCQMYNTPGKLVSEVFYTCENP